MKKLFAIPLVLVLCFASLVGCGGEPVEATEAATTTEITTTEAPTSTEGGIAGKWGHVILSDNGFATRYLDLEFTADNKVNFMLGYNGSGYGGNGSGSYVLDGERIHLNLTAEIGDEEEVNQISMSGLVTYELQDGKLVLIPVEGDTLKTHWFDFLDAPNWLALTKNRSIYDYA